MNIRGSWRLKKTWTLLNRLGVVLMYHRVAPLDRDLWKINVSLKHFEEHLQVLKKHGVPMPFKDIGKKLGQFSWGPKGIAATFDDGYADNYHNAKPLLERYEIPGTFFIVSGAINSREEYWWDELEQIILSNGNLPEIFELSIAGTQYHWTVKNQPQDNTDYSQMTTPMPGPHTVLSKIQLYYVLWQILTHLSFQEKKAALKQIAQWSGQTLMPRAGNLAMTSDELMSMARSPLVEIGAHTVHHPMLSRLPAEEQEMEISSSKRDIENIIGKPVTSFSYPHGEFGPQTAGIVKNLKFQAACTVVPQTVTRKTDPYLLPRFAVQDWDGDQFEKYLHKWLTNI